MPGAGAQGRGRSPEYPQKLFTNKCQGLIKSHPMADVFIRQTKPSIVDENWPPKIEAPVQSDRVEFFPPAPQPLVRSDAPIIFGLAQTELPEDNRTPVSVGSTETRFATSYEPISNERGSGTIFGTGPTQHSVNLPPPPLPIGNTEVQMTPNPSGALGNDPTRSIMYAPASNYNEQAQQSHPLQPRVAAQAPINNEGAQFTFSPQPIAFQGDSFVPNLGTKREQESQGVLDNITVGNKDVQFVQGRHAHAGTSDTTFGGGGDTTKPAGQEDKSFAGLSTLNVGSSDTYLAPSGDTTKDANSSDRTMSPSVGNIGNQESNNGSVGDPTGYGDREVGLGGKNQPKNVKG